MSTTAHGDDLLSEEDRRRFNQLLREEHDTRDTIRDLRVDLRREWRNLPLWLIRQRLREISYRRRKLRDIRREMRQLVG